MHPPLFCIWLNTVAFSSTHNTVTLVNANAKVGKIYIRKMYGFANFLDYHCKKYLVCLFMTEKMKITGKKSA